MLRVGVIGLGVGEQHILATQNNEYGKITKICDFNKNKLNSVVKNFSEIKTCSHASDIINDPEIDVVVVASFDDWHAEHVCASIRAGKHVFVEKPLCLTFKELKNIELSLKQKSGIRICSNLILRMVPRFTLLKKKIDEGVLGKIYHVEGDYDYGRLEKLLSGWRGNTPNYSVFHGGAIHLLDLLIWLTGFLPYQVHALGSNFSSFNSSFKGNDFVTSLIKCKNGQSMKIGSNFGSVTPHHHVISVYGTKGSFFQNHLGASYIFSRDPKKSRIYLNDDYPGVSKGAVLQDFLNSIYYKKKPIISKEEVLNVMKLSLNIEYASQKNKIITINL
jgi:predicted dehydrogenase